MLFGAVATISGLSSCNKDDGGNECCTVVYDGYKYVACEDGSMTISEDGEVIESYSWKQEFNSWAEVKDEAYDYGGSCS